MNTKIIHSILCEYGVRWAVDRSLYSVKLWLLRILPKIEILFERKVSYPKSVDIFNIDVDNLRLFIKNLPEDDKRKIIKNAELACKGIIRGFSSIELDYGYPVRWQLNPLTGNECDIAKKWYQISDFDKDRGDIKVIWEISRFTHFITLARAYLLTEDERFYKSFSVQLAHWLDNNPYSYGANYKCGQECSIRMVNALLAYAVFKKCEVTTNDDKKNIEKLIMRCYRKILSNFFYAYKCIKNNHTISELMGIILGSWCCDDEKQLGYAFKTLDKVIDDQFTEDGGYIQFSFNYQRLALQDIEVVLAIEKMTGYTLNARSRRKIQNATQLMYQCQDISGDMPNYGSNDGALILPVTSCGYRDFRPVINTVHALLTGYTLYCDGRYDEELIWFSTKGKENYKQKRVERSSSAFKQAGLYTLRSNNSWLMIVLNVYNSRPAHMDQMHVDLWIDGINVLCDGGTFSYASDFGKKLVGNGSHNTIIYDNKTQMNTYGPFMICDWTKSSKSTLYGNSFYGIMHSQNGYKHKRYIEAIDDEYRIEDCVEGEEGKCFEIRFHTVCEVEIEEDIVNLIYEEKKIGIMQFDKPFYVFRSSRSLYYLKSEETNCIVVSGKIQDGMGKVISKIRTKENNKK